MIKNTKHQLSTSALLLLSFQLLYHRPFFLLTQEEKDNNEETNLFEVNTKQLSLVALSTFPLKSYVENFSPHQLWSRGYCGAFFTTLQKFSGAHWLNFIQGTDIGIYNLCDASTRADNLTICYCTKQIEVCLSCFLPVIDNEFRHNIVSSLSA